MVEARSLKGLGREGVEDTDWVGGRLKAIRYKKKKLL